MFKEIGNRLTNGTVNLAITQKDGIMSVVVFFKDVPGSYSSFFTGTPEEIDDVFIKKLEQPMKTISKFNFDMEIFRKEMKEVAVDNGLKKAKMDKSEGDKALDEKKHQANVEAMKREVETVEKVEDKNAKQPWDPFADDEEIQL